MGDGLKQQWGVDDPAKPGSDQQSKQFQAAFQQQIEVRLGNGSRNREAKQYQGTHDSYSFFKV